MCITSRHSPLWAIADGDPLLKTKRGDRSGYSEVSQDNPTDGLKPCIGRVLQTCRPPTTVKVHLTTVYRIRETQTWRANPHSYSLVTYLVTRAPSGHDGLGWASVRTPPMPYRLLKLAEDGA